MTTGKRTDREEECMDRKDALIPDLDRRLCDLLRRNRDPEWARAGKYYLSKTETTIGRGSDADIFIDDDRVSSIHASICWNQDGYVLKNLSATNGTDVNGIRVVGEKKLQNGDRIELAAGAGLKVCLFKEMRGAATKPNQTFQLLLKVILDADVVDSTRLTCECGTFITRKRLDDCYDQIFWLEHTKHHADFIEKVGDNILVVFSTVEDAISYAKAVQRSLDKFNQHLPVAEQMQFRMGIDCGDVMFDARQNPGECVCGNAVNISNSIQEKAPNGGVCVSQVVYELADKREHEFESVGALELEEGLGPNHLYRLKLD